MKRILCRSLLPGLALASRGRRTKPPLRSHGVNPGRQVPPAATCRHAPRDPRACGSGPNAPAAGAPPAVARSPGRLLWARELALRLRRPFGGVAPGVRRRGRRCGKAGDTRRAPQSEQGVDYEPKSPNYRVAFSLEDADLPEIVRVIGQLTGKRFIFGGKVRNIKATVYSPQKVTVAEAYQAFLSILETNGLTVIPHGRFLKIVETAGIMRRRPPPPTPRRVRAARRTKIGTSPESIVSAMRERGGGGERPRQVQDRRTATSSYTAPGNLLIITDTGSNIRRMMQNRRGRSTSAPRATRSG